MEYGNNTYSRKILIFIGIFYLLNILMDGKMAGLVSLTPSMLNNYSDFWRIFTFTLAPGSFEAAFLFFFTFYALAPRIEEYFNNNLFPVLLLLLTSLQGIVHTLIFWNSEILLAGFEGASFFVITLFMFIKPAPKIKLGSLPSLNVKLLAGIVCALWLGVKTFSALNAGGEKMILAASVLAFGVFTGLTIFLQVYFFRKIQLKKQKEVEGPYEFPKPEELKLAMISHSKTNKLNKSIVEEYDGLESDPDLNEEKLNAILDKILESGKDSLSLEEIKFLEDYSKQLD